MKTRKLISKLFEASLGKDQTQASKIYQKLLQKSLKHKNTLSVR